LPALLAVFALPTAAQQLPGGKLKTPNVVLEDSVQHVRLEQPFDSLAAVPAAPAIDSVRLAWLQTPPTQRDLIGDRISCFETEVPRQFNNAVLAYVNLFTQRQRSYTQRVLEREQFYFPIFEKYLAQYNLPLDLKYLAVVESALIPTAKSRVGATGLWQFMGPTAGDLNLRFDEWVDERMHPEKATEAACKHLKYLYGMFQDWELVLAAYNWGGGSMRRVMKRTGKKTFWDLYPHLPAETRNYVPTFTAIMYTMKYADQHQLRAPELRYQQAEPLDTLRLNGQPLDLRRLSRALGYADSMALQRFNPEVRRRELPAGYRPYVLRFPSAARPHLGEVDRATLLDYCRPVAELAQPLQPRIPRLDGVETFPTRELLAADSGPRADTEATGSKSRRVRHTVRRGETVAKVAARFEVSSAQVRRWNDLPKGAALTPGRQLVVFVPQPAMTPPAGSAVAAASALPAGGTVAISAVPAVLPVPRPAADEAAERLAAANARYAREAAELAAREKAQAQHLARLQKAEAARLAARATAEQQRLAIARSVAATQAAALAKANRQAPALASAQVKTDESLEQEETVATDSASQTAGTSRAITRTVPVRADKSSGALPTETTRRSSPAAGRPTGRASSGAAAASDAGPAFSSGAGGRHALQYLAAVQDFGGRAAQAQQATLQ
jgi:membrane-bound lytic murein transglycosylase D